MKRYCRDLLGHLGGLGVVGDVVCLEEGVGLGNNQWVVLARSDGAEVAINIFLLVNILRGGLRSQSLIR
jgi:hypothetical protein